MRILTVVVLNLLTICPPAAAQDLPTCLAAPPALNAGATSFVQDPICQALFKVLAATAPRDIAWIPGAGVNALLGLNEGGFAEGAYVLQFRVSTAFNRAFDGADELVRFAIDEGRARGGSWWTPLEFVTDGNGRLLHPDQIENVLALPTASAPTVIAYSTAVQVGTSGYVGLVAPAFGHSGGALQFWFPSEPVFTTRVTPLAAPE